MAFFASALEVLRALVIAVGTRDWFLKGEKLTVVCTDVVRNAMVKKMLNYKIHPP